MKNINLSATKFWALVLILLINIQLSHSQTLSMGLSIKKTLSPTWLGYNGQSTIRNGEHWNESNFMANLPLLKPKVLRYPAGGNSNFWDWKRGWFINSAVCPPNYSSLPRMADYLENFKITKDSCHADALLVLNMVTATLQDQMAMLKHADSIGIPVKYVELGEEFYLEGLEDDCGPGTLYVDSLFPYVKTYADMANIWIDTIHHYFPNCKVGVLGVFEKNLKPKRVKWNDSLKVLINHHEDAWTYHTYFSSHWSDTTQTLADKQVETIDEVPDWMYQPYKCYNILKTTIEDKLPAGKDVWITEYNMTDHERPVHGLWAHGLYVSLQSMQFLNDERIKMLTAFSIVGSAAYGQYFFTTSGFQMGGETDEWALLSNPPATTYWGMTAAGNNMKMLGEATNNKTNASPLVFTPSPQITVVEAYGTQTRSYDGVYGWLFNNSTGSDAIILNLTGTAYTINTSALFTSGGTYVQKYAGALAPIANSATDVTVVSGSLPATLTLQPYSSTKITSSFVPAAPPTVNITVNGATSICVGDSVQLEAPTAMAAYVWSTGATTRTIWVKTTGDYWVHAYAVAAGYYGTATVHITVNPLPPNASINVTNGVVNLCQGQTTQLNSNQVFYAYLWSNGGTTSSITVGASGDYTLTGIDTNGCRLTSLPKTITVYSLPTPTIVAQGPIEFCYNQSVTLAVTTAYSTYFWSTGNYGQTRTVSTEGSYFCTVTDAHGCTGNSNSISTIVHNVPVPAVTTSSGSLTFCSNSGVYLTTSTTGFNYQWQLGGVNISGATNQTYTPAASGNYRVRLTDAYGCTNKSNAISPVINVAPTPGILGTPSICEGQSTTLSTVLSYSSYLWSTGATTSTVSVSATGNYTVNVTDANGCTGISATPKTVIVNPLPTPTATALGPTQFCTGGSVDLTVPGTYSTYYWSSGNYGQTHNYTASGTYSCLVTDANGCTGNSNSITVTVGALPIPVITSSTGSLTFCNNVSAYLSTSLSGYNYQWLKGGVVQNGATNQTYYPTVGGSYKVKITDDGGCTSTSVGNTVTVNTAPQPTITGSTTICQGSSTSLNSSITTTSYLWSTGATTQSISTSTGATYTLTVTDVNGCTGVAPSVTTTVYALPTATITSVGPIEFCDGGSDSLKSSAATSYSWSNGKTTRAINVTASGTFTVTVTDSHGCTKVSSPATVTEYILPVPDMTSSTGSFTFCDNVGAYLTTSITGYSYQWLKGTTELSGATAQNYTPVTGGSYKVRITNGLGCTNIAVASTITMNLSPAPTINGSTSICQGSSTSLSSSITGTSYLWSTGATTQSISTSTANSYTVTVTDANGCTGITPAVATTVYSLPTATITSVGPTTFCSGGSDSLKANSASSYLWSNGATTRAINVTASGNYVVTITDSHGCTGTSSPITITVGSLAVPTVTSSTGSFTYCDNVGAYLTTSSSGYNYQWLKGSTLLTGATNQTYVPSSDGTYKVRITDNGGCSSTSTGKSVTIYIAPAPTITGLTSICQGSSASLSSSITGTSYHWSTGATTQSISTSTGATFTVTVSDANGCNGISPAVTTTVYALPTATITSVGATDFCDGGSDSLKASLNSSYLWSNGKTSRTINVAASGTFTVTVTDSHGCTKVSAPTTINEWILPNPAITPVGPTTYCKSSPASYLSTISGYSYQWLKGTAVQNGATGQTWQPGANGTYKVKITDSHGCTKTSASGVKVTVYNLPVASISNSGASNLCGTATTTLSETTGSGNTYQWKKNGTNITGSTTATYVTGAAGAYTCLVTNSNGCTLISNSITLTNNCKMDDGEFADDAIRTTMNLYPNPAINGIHIDAQFASQANGEATMEIRNLLGEVIYIEKQQINGGKYSSDILFDHQFSAGSYFARISLDDDQVMQQFLIAQPGK